jgi:hypothetical protein
MEIDADVMEKLPNNQPHFGCPWSVRVRLVGVVLFPQYVNYKENLRQCKLF